MENGITIKARLNLKIDKELKEWAMEYAKRMGTDVTKLITSYFISLRAMEKAAEDCVEQF